MKTVNVIALLTLVLIICGTLQLSAQNLVISDTVQGATKQLTDSSFSVHGDVVGFDSGSLKLSWAKKVAYVPIRQGRFAFSGFVKSPELVVLQIVGDYYVSGFYVEPGSVALKGKYQDIIRASGTKENDLRNSFFDGAKGALDQLWQLGRDVDTAMASQDLDRYLALVDSFKTAEQTYLALVDTAIAEQRYGLYLLGAINNYYISYGYFERRKAQFAKLPEELKNSSVGQQTLASIEVREKKSQQQLNKTAYPFALKDMAGKVVSLDQYKGKVVVLDFWASWCLPCIKSLPLLKKLQAHKVAEDVAFISVSIDKKAEDWRAREKGLAIPWQSVLADTTTVAKYGVDVVPNYMVIDKVGRIVNSGASLATLIASLQAMKKDVGHLAPSAQRSLAKRGAGE